MNSNYENATKSSPNKEVDGQRADTANTIEDLPAATDPKGGILVGLLLPAVQKVRGG